MPAAPGANPKRIQAIARSFQRACLAARIPWRDRLRYWLYHILLARRGVMVHSPERDAVYQDGFLRRGYQKYCDRINRRLDRRPAAPAPVEVPEFAHGELALADLQLLMRRNIPFVIRNGAADLPARNWSLDYLEQVAGPCSVPINGAADQPAAETSRPTRSHHYYRFHTGTLAEVIASIRQGGNLRASTAEDVMHHDNGRLRRDLDLDHFERVSGWAVNREHWLRRRLLVGKIVGAQLLLQPPGAFTIWHCEPGDNFFVLARGEKDWTLAHPYYTAAMRPRVKNTTNYFGCNIDVRESEAVQRRRGFDGYLKIPKVKVRVRAGDVLRVPNHWWHTVQTEPGEYTVAATIRAVSPPNLAGFGYMVLRLLDRQYHEMARAWIRDGRIQDSHIGYPRRSRGTAG